MNRAPYPPWIRRVSFGSRVCAKSLDKRRLSFREAIFATRNLVLPPVETSRCARSDNLPTLHTP